MAIERSRTAIVRDLAGCFWGPLPLAPKGREGEGFDVSGWCAVYLGGGGEGEGLEKGREVPFLAMLEE